MKPLMKKSHILSVFLLFSIVFVILPGSFALHELNHTEHIQDIHSLLDLIEQRVRDAIEAKDHQLSQVKSHLEQDLNEKQKQYDTAKATLIQEQTRVETQYIDAQEAAQQNYEMATEAAQQMHDKALEDAQDAYGEGLKTVSLREQEYNASALALNDYERYIEMEHERLEQGYNAFHQNMKAELQLIDKIRVLLNAVHSRNVKDVLQHCDNESSYGCRPGMECIDNVCRIYAYSSRSCRTSDECVSGTHCSDAQRCYPSSCKSIKAMDDAAESGMYDIVLEEKKAPDSVFCEMEYRGGGWTMFANIKSGGSQPYPGRENQGSDPDTIPFSRNMNGIQLSEIAVFHNAYQGQEGSQASFSLAQQNSVWDSSRQQLDFELDNGRLCVFSVSGSQYNGNHRAAACNVRRWHVCNENREDTFGIVSQSTGDCADLRRTSSNSGCGSWGLNPFKGDTSTATYGVKFFVR